VKKDEKAAVRLAGLALSTVVRVGDSPYKADHVNRKLSGMKGLKQNETFYYFCIRLRYLRD